MRKASAVYNVSCVPLQSTEAHRYASHAPADPILLALALAGQGAAGRPVAQDPFQWPHSLRGDIHVRVRLDRVDISDTEMSYDKIHPMRAAHTSG